MLGIVPEAFVALAIFDQSQEDLKGFTIPMKKGPEYPIPFYRSKGWQASVSEPALAETNYHGKESVFPEDVKGRNWICASCKCSPSPQAGLLPCVAGEGLAQRVESSNQWENASSPSSCPCSGHALQSLGAFQWLICSHVSASWSVLPSPWNPAHTSPPTHTLWFQLQIGTTEEKGKIVVVRRWRSETQMKQKV